MALNPGEYAQFLANAQVQLTGASENGVKLALFEVLREFFNDSGSWTEDIPLVVTAAQQDYSIAPANDGQAIRLVGVFDSKGIPVPAFMAIFGQLHLVNAPQSNGDPNNPLTVRVEKNVVQPTTDSGLPIAPDWTLRVYSQHILDGVLGQMMMQPNKSYSDKTLAAYHLKRFRAGIALARTQAKRMNGVGNQTWAYPNTVPKGSQRGGVNTAWPTRAF